MEISGYWESHVYGMSCDETTGTEWREPMYASGNRAAGKGLLKPFGVQLISPWKSLMLDIVINNLFFSVLYFAFTLDLIVCFYDVFLLFSLMGMAILCNHGLEV